MTYDGGNGSRMQSNQALQASAFVGSKVMVTCQTIRLSLGMAHIVVDVPAAIQTLQVVIRSSSGELIRQLQQDVLHEGLVTIDWDGRNQNGEVTADGHYPVTVQGNCADIFVSLPAMTAANVDSVYVGRNGGGVCLNVAGIGEVALDRARIVLEL